MQLDPAARQLHECHAFALGHQSIRPTHRRERDLLPGVHLEPPRTRLWTGGWLVLLTELRDGLLHA